MSRKRARSTSKRAAICASTLAASEANVWANARCSAASFTDAQAPTINTNTSANKLGSSQ
ncbi:hypothetical protein [Giesbergeria giesbergeri]